MKRPRGRRQRVELFEAALGTGIGQALAGWAAEFTHDLLERDPELRARLRANWLAMYERIAQMDTDTSPRRGRARRRAPAAAY